MTLQKHVASLLGLADIASEMLMSLATAARKSGRLPIAMNALHELQATLRSFRESVPRSHPLCCVQCQCSSHMHMKLSEAPLAPAMSRCEVWLVEMGDIVN